jgi:hypothetical protein
MGRIWADGASTTNLGKERIRDNVLAERLDVAFSGFGIGHFQTR